MPSEIAITSDARLETGEAPADAFRLDEVRAVAVVPSLWAYEVGNVLLLGERRKRSNAVETSRWVAMLMALPIELDAAAPRQVLDAVLPVARSHDLTVYDAAYLELALRRGLRLASLDDKLLVAAQAAGVSRFIP